MNESLFFFNWGCRHAVSHVSRNFSASHVSHFYSHAFPTTVNRSKVFLPTFRRISISETNYGKNFVLIYVFLGISIIYGYQETLMNDGFPEIEMILRTFPEEDPLKVYIPDI